MFHVEHGTYPLLALTQKVMRTIRDVPRGTWKAVAMYNQGVLAPHDIGQQGDWYPFG